MTRVPTGLRPKTLTLLVAVAVSAMASGCGGGADDSSSAALAAVDSAGVSNPASHRAQTQAASKSVTVNATSPLPKGATTSASANPSLTVRARGTIAGNIGPIIDLRVDGVSIGTQEVRTTDLADYVFSAPSLHAGAAIDLVYTNDQIVGGVDRNLYVSYVDDGASTVMPSSPGVLYDRGAGAKAFDGLDVIAGISTMYWGGALRFVWPAGTAGKSASATAYDASRFLQQATFGPTQSEIDRLGSLSFSAWIDSQLAMPPTTAYVNFVQSKFNLGDAYRPGGANYTPSWTEQQFWNSAATGSDQLRQRVVFALHHTLMVSQQESAMSGNVRAYASYLDTLNADAFGNFRTLLEDVSLSPAMGLYLSHMRNQKENPATNRTPDENFAREAMQLFTIGPYELNNDGTNRLDANGKPIEAYTNDDVMALAKVFTGWTWAFPAGQLTDSNFSWLSPDYSAAKDQRIDLLKMQPYANQHSTAQVTLFAGKTNTVTIPANTSATDALRIALDTLFQHRNVGPFICRQLIQQLVTSQPTPAYVGRVATVFNNNGKGVRGDMAAVVRSILLDTEARSAPTANFGKLVEPVVRITRWMRAFNVTSASGQFQMPGSSINVQRPLYSPTVFSYFRPGYVPPNTGFAQTGATAPEYQIVNEATTAYWINQVDQMLLPGIGTTGPTGPDMQSTLAPQVAIATSGDTSALIENMNLLLFAGRMSPQLRQNLVDGLSGITGSSSLNNLNRAQLAVYLSMSSPEFFVQR